MNITYETNFKSGHVAILGRPNVGKSTLVNALLGQKITAVSPRPQTTRKRQMGILTDENVQVVFVDTPGIHHPRHKLGEYMNQQALEALQESDLILFLVDANSPPDEEDQLLVYAIQKANKVKDTFVVLNKIDLISAETLTERLISYQDLLPAAEIHPVSAKRGDHLKDLLQHMIERLPEGPRYYPSEQITDLYEREIVADLIRAAALSLLRDEVPHGIAMRIDEFTERGESGAFIAATMFVERESHKPIVIGKNGAMLKKIGMLARQEIEMMSGRNVFLKLRIKVRKNWRDDESVLRHLGFKK